MTIPCRRQFESEKTSPWSAKNFGRILAGILLGILVCSQPGCFLRKKPAAPAASPSIAFPPVNMPATPVINIPLPVQVQRNFAREAVEINYAADVMLNSFDSKAHTLLLVVYQLADVNSYNRLIKSEEGIKKLLEADSFDPSVAGVDRFVAQPGETRLVKLNRAENAKWVAIVAGYYELGPHVVSRLVSIPVIVEKQGNQEVNIADRVHINLYLSPYSLQQLDSKSEVF